MILGISSFSFFLLMLCAFVAGCAGAVCVLVIVRFTRDRKHVKAEAVKTADRSALSGWQRAAQDEQIYNGR